MSPQGRFSRPFAIALIAALLVTAGCDSAGEDEPFLSGRWTGSVSQSVGVDSTLDVDAQLDLDAGGESIDGSGTVTGILSWEDGGFEGTEEVEFTDDVSGTRASQQVTLTVSSGADTFVFSGQIADGDASIGGTVAFTTGADSYEVPFTLHQE